ncbi:MAG: hypothetical protein L0Y56_19570, partial [Nitrospira sp.]|nr:hypothetical protein [Nitrospira sp.]
EVLGEGEMISSAVVVQEEVVVAVQGAVEVAAERDSAVAAVVVAQEAVVVVLEAAVVVLEAAVVEQDTIQFPSIWEDMVPSHTPMYRSPYILSSTTC